jgi:hypothetical protein
VKSRKIIPRPDSKYYIRDDEETFWKIRGNFSEYGYLTNTDDLYLYVAQDKDRVSILLKQGYVAANYNELMEASKTYIENEDNNQDEEEWIEEES